jgi:hypothetical protein
MNCPGRQRQIRCAVTGIRGIMRRLSNLPIGMIMAVEPRRRQMRPMAMLQSLLSAIAETFLISTWHAILKFFRWEQAAELAGALVGLICIVIGFTIVLPGR